MQNGRKIIPLACAGRKLTGPPEGYDSRKAAQVKEWLQQIPPNDVLEHEVENKSVLSVKNDDSESQKEPDTKLESERPPSEHAQNEELQNVEEAELPGHESVFNPHQLQCNLRLPEKSEHFVSEQEVKPSPEEDNSASSLALTHEAKSDSHARCWKVLDPLLRKVFALKSDCYSAGHFWSNSYTKGRGMKNWRSI